MVVEVVVPLRDLVVEVVVVGDRVIEVVVSLMHARCLLRRMSSGARSQRHGQTGKKRKRDEKHHSPLRWTASPLKAS